MLKISLAAREGKTAAVPGLPEWMGRLLDARGVRTEAEIRQFLQPSMEHLQKPARLCDMEKAAGLLRQAADEKKTVAIYGDYDVDGVSASAILWEALGMMGVRRDVYIPDRHQEGYGLNCPAVEHLAEDHQVLVTVDCGITSVQEVQRAKELCMTVIVTDHHRHGDALPPADAVISPLLGDYPFPFLCGAGVAWKLAKALVGEKADALLDIAALATIADMVPLTGENRVIAALGLEALAHTRRVGLRAVMNRAGLQGKITGDQVAFQIAPRMNACGRMASARIALDMLLTRDAGQAEELALTMEGLNQQRKTQESRVLAEALEQVARMDLVDIKAIVVCGEGWNSGVVGLAAGRVAEQFAYPTVALAQEGDTCVGSARSAGDIDIHLALSQCADLFDRFGGHKQAAGLTIPAKNVPDFVTRLSRAVAEQTGGRPVIPEILCDGELSLGDVTEETVGWLQKLEPFGIGNPAPRFLCDGVRPLSLRAVGAEGRHLKCTLQQGSDIRDGIFFGGGAWAGKTDGSLRLVLSPTLNEFRGNVTAECRLYALQLVPESLADHPAREAVSLFSDSFTERKARPIEPSRLDELMADGQGTLLVCRCRETALEMYRRFPDADFCVGEAKDVRAFHSILLYGCAGTVSAPFRRVVLCDGDMGEGDAWQQALPQARVYALPQTAAMERLLRRCFADVDALRICYASLRHYPPHDLSDVSARTGLAPEQAAFALRVLADIGLLELTFSPFRVSLLPMRKRSPEESALFQWTRPCKEG